MNELSKLVSQHKYDEAFAAALRIILLIEVCLLQPFLIDFFFLG
jgi:hypothetical protein